MRRIRACVTGGNGFIGRHLIKELCENNFSVTILSRRTDTRFPEGVDIVQGDLTSDDCNLDGFLEACDVIFHCAGEIYDESKMKSLHVSGTQKLVDKTLETIKNSKKPIHWVQLSSVGVYGHERGKSSKERVVTEGSPLMPNGEYETTKAMSDDIIKGTVSQNGFTYTIVRPSNVIGEDMTNSSLKSLAGVIQKRAFFYIGEKGTISTYIHVNDVVKLLVTCAKENKAKGEIFNISNDCILEDVVNSIADSLQVKRPKLRLPESVIRTTEQVLSTCIKLPLTKQGIDVLTSRTTYPNKKLQEYLEFKPKVSIPAVIGNTVVNDLERRC